MLRCALIGRAVKQMSLDLPEMPRLSAAATFVNTANTSASSSSCCTQTASVMQPRSRAHNSLINSAAKQVHGIWSTLCAAEKKPGRVECI